MVADASAGNLLFELELKVSPTEVGDEVILSLPLSPDTKKCRSTREVSS
jgi:hypothetical protein